VTITASIITSLLRHINEYIIGSNLQDTVLKVVMSQYAVIIMYSQVNNLQRSVLKILSLFCMIGRDTL